MRYFFILQRSQKRCVIQATLQFALQLSLHACEVELSALDIYANKKQLMCIRFGSRFTGAELVTASSERPVSYTHLTLPTNREV